MAYTGSGMLPLCCTAVISCQGAWGQRNNDALKCLRSPSGALMNGDRLCLQSKRCWHCWILHLLEKYQNICYPWANVCVRCSWGGEELLSEWMSGMMNFSGEMDWTYAWMSDCQKGNITPAEVEFCPAQSPFSKPLWEWKVRRENQSLSM